MLYKVTVHRKKQNGASVFTRLAASKPAAEAFPDTSTPAGLPVPVDDGACNHLTNMKVPSLALPATSGDRVDVSALSGLTVLFCYPRTGAPGETIPDSWNAIPGARGCTPQACSFRDASDKLKSLGVSRVFGLSTQDTAYQREAKERLHLQYQLLSDAKLDFVHALKLPTFEFEGNQMVKRMCLVIESGTIIKVHYPDFPSDKSADWAAGWIEEYQGKSK